VFDVRVDIKTVKSKDYVQLVDDHGFIHHIGPANAANLAAAFHAKGFREAFKVNRWLEDYYVSKGCELGEDTTHKVSEIAVSYYDGLLGFTPRGSDLYDRKEVEEIFTKLNERMHVHEMIRGDLIEMLERAGRHVNEAQIRKIVQETYREASEERRRRYKEQYDERFTEQLLRAFRPMGSLP